MAIEHVQGLAHRIETLKDKLAARLHKKEYKDNIKDIQAEINRIEKILAEKQALASGGETTYDL